MSIDESTNATIRTVRFHAYGDPSEVLRLERIAVPTPAAGRVRVVVHACGLNPADWALCQGLFAGLLPRGIGLEVAGIVDAIGEGVTDLAVGDRAMGMADYAGETSAGAADRAILKHWARVPAELELAQAAALPMAVETAYRSLTNLRVGAGQTLLVNGAGTTVGFAAVQIALLRGARVFASAGSTFAERLRALGATVTAYGDGLGERVLALAGGAVELALDCAPVSGVLPELVRAVGGDPLRVLTISDFAGAAKLGVRNTFGEEPRMYYDVLGEFVAHAAAGRLIVPIARTFALEDWRAALDLSRGGHPHGKLLLLLGS